MDQHLKISGLVCRRGNTRSRRSTAENGKFVRRGELSSYRREDHELSMLSLHLLQKCMLYVNTVMVQQVLARPEWKGRLTPRDLHALTPLFWTHVNPYGCFELDMRTHINALTWNGPRVMNVLAQGQLDECYPANSPCGCRFTSILPA